MAWFIEYRVRKATHIKYSDTKRSETRTMKKEEGEEEKDQNGERKKEKRKE